MDDTARGDGGEVFLKLLGSAGEDRHHVGTVMDRHGVLDAQEPDGVGSLERAHDQPVADGQQGEVGAVDLTYKLHIAEDGGVASVIEPETALKLEDIAHGLAAVDEVSIVRLDARGVEGVGRGNPDPADLGGAAFLDRYRVFDTLAL